MTDSERRAARVLDLLYDAEDEFPYIFKLLGNDYDPGEWVMWFDLLRDLRDQGLIELPPGMHEGITPKITARGRQEVEARRAQQANPANRTRAARTAILSYLYEQPGYEAAVISRLLVSRYATFASTRLAMTDIKEGIKYLKRKGLITAIEFGSNDELARPQLTEPGIECVEDYNGSVDDYLRRDTRTPRSISISSGPGSNVAISNGGSARAGNTTHTEVDAGRPAPESDEVRRSRKVQTWAAVIGLVIAAIAIFVSP